jgi:hypothetical protein
MPVVGNTDYLYGVAGSDDVVGGAGGAAFLSVTPATPPGGIDVASAQGGAGGDGSAGNGGDGGAAAATIGGGGQADAIAVGGAGGSGPGAGAHGGAGGGVRRDCQPVGPRLEPRRLHLSGRG